MLLAYGCKFQSEPNAQPLYRSNAKKNAICYSFFTNTLYKCDFLLYNIPESEAQPPHSQLPLQSDLAKGDNL